MNGLCVTNLEAHALFRGQQQLQIARKDDAQADPP